MGALNSTIYKIAKGLALFLRLFRVLKDTVDLHSGDKELTPSHSVSCKYLSEFVTLIEKPR